MAGGALTVSGTWFTADATVTVGGDACAVTATSLAGATQTLTCASPAMSAEGAKAVVVSVNSVASTDAVSVTYRECTYSVSGLAVQGGHASAALPASQLHMYSCTAACLCCEPACCWPNSLALVPADAPVLTTTSWALQANGQATIAVDGTWFTTSTVVKIDGTAATCTEASLVFTCTAPAHAVGTSSVQAYVAGVASTNTGTVTYCECCAGLHCLCSCGTDVRCKHG